MANEPKRYGGKRRVKGAEKLQGMRPPRKSKFGKAPAIVPALMGGQSGLINYGLGKLTPWIKDKIFGRPSPPKKPKKPSTSTPSKKPSASTPSRSSMKRRTGRSRK
jgi:hypothetical protein